MKKQHRLNVSHIAVHKTSTTQDLPITTFKRLPYHYIVLPDGELINLRRVVRIDAMISIAWVGGIDKTGRQVDNRTGDQEDTLFSSLVMLSERFPKATIVGADEIAGGAFPGPGFNIKQWLAEYIPKFLQS